jgi:hypothetical protein
MPVSLPPVEHEALPLDPLPLPRVAIPRATRLLATVRDAAGFERPSPPPSPSPTPEETLPPTSLKTRKRFSCNVGREKRGGARVKVP